MYLKEFYTYLKVKFGSYAYFDQVFGNKPNKKNLTPFFSIELIQLLLQSCFSQKENLLQVLLNYGPSEDEDEFDLSQDGSFESTKSRSSVNSKKAAASPKKGRGKATPVKLTIKRVKKDRKKHTAREILWLHHEVCHTLNLAECWPDELKEYGQANIKKVGRGKPKNPASLGIKKSRRAPSKP